MNKQPIGILLAAGGSRRLGQPKQLVLYQGKSLLELTLSTFLESFPKSELIVVLGSHNKKLLPIVSKPNVTILINTHWDKGLSSSLKIANIHIQNHLEKYLDASFIMLSCDQYLLKPNHLNKLYETYSHTKKPCFTKYDATSWGIPCCIPYSLVGQAPHLTGEEGIKKLIQDNQDITFVQNNSLAQDLDTPDDLKRIKNQ